MNKNSPKQLIKVLLTISVLLFGIRELWDWHAPVRTVNFRLEVTFEVDGKPVTGSGVQRFVVGKAVGIGQQTYRHRIFGEAVVVDLPDRPSVFALLAFSRYDRNGVYVRPSGGYNFLIEIACKLRERTKGFSPAEYVRFVGRLNRTCDIPNRYLPIMVVFSDETDPASVKRVIPEFPEQALGKGVKFIGESITVTKTATTQKIKKRLPWISEYEGDRLTSGYTYSPNPSLPDYLRHGYFERFSK
nr:hypothetical protein [uncultured Cohaesibacter sp.]